VEFKVKEAASQEETSPFGSFLRLKKLSTACSYRAKNSSPEKNQAGRFRNGSNRRRNGINRVIGNGHCNTVEELMVADAKHIKTQKLAALKVVNVRNSVDLQIQISRINHYKKASKAVYRASWYWSDGREGCYEIGTRIREGREHPKSTVEVIRKRIGTRWNGGSSENDGGSNKTSKYAQDESPVFSKLIRSIKTFPQSHHHMSNR
jgi:hypothetical protein